MEVNLNSSSAFSKKKSSKSRITSKGDINNNSNVLVGPNEFRKIKTASIKPYASSEKDGFHTDKFKTKNSAWTPVLNPYNNNKLYQERVDLIGHWFSMWTDAQCKKFLSFILQRCTKSQMKYLKLGYFNHPLPIYHQDFTTVLPRFISMYIFSFLDPRSLSRAAMVSWHWKFLCEQDEIWMPKCQRFGWFLPYKPDVNKYGAWKNHYIMCYSTLDVEGPSEVKMAEMYGQFGVVPPDKRSSKRKSKGKEKSARKSKEILYYRQDNHRPPWIYTDQNPKDLDDARKALLDGYDPNHSTALDSLRRKRLGLNTRPHQRSQTAPVGGSTRKTERARSASAGFSVEETQRFDLDDKEPLSSTRMTLSEALSIEACVDPSVVEQAWPNTIPTSPVRRKDLTRGIHPSAHDSVTGTRRSTQVRLLILGKPFNHSFKNVYFRFSRTQSCPAVVFISSEVPAREVLLSSVLFETVAIPYEYESTTLEALLERLKLVLDGREAKCVAFFAVGDCGTIRLVRGGHVTSASLHEPEMKFFWESVTTSVVHKSRGGHVDIFIPLTETEPGMDLLVQLGLLTDMQISCPTGMTGSYAGVESEWLYEPEGVRPSRLYFNTEKLGAWSNLLDYLEECSSLVRDKLEPCFSEEHKRLCQRVIGESVFKFFGLSYVDHLSGVANLIVEATNKLRKETTEYGKNELLEQIIEQLQAAKEGRASPKKSRKTTQESLEQSDEDESDGNDEEKHKFPVGTGKSAGERRTALAQEILSSEVSYMQTLNILKEVFKTPLQAALASNRAIISLPNINALFADTDTLLAISRVMVDELSKRLANNNWDSHQCLGDVFMKFTAQLKAYTNFLNNYPVTLATLQRCKEQNPQFRAFLRRHENQPNTKMQSLAELFLEPGKRLKSYIDLLQKLLRYTPADHVDRRNVTQAIARIQDIADIFKQYNERLDRERSLQELQKTILNCPVLAERGRRLIREEDFALLTSPTTGNDVKPEYRLFLHVGDVGMYLFNDCLVAAVLKYNFVPFKRLVRRSYKFQACVSLKKLKVQNVVDTKHLKNAFVLVSSKRMWLCQASSWDQKIRWITVLENTIVTAIEGR
ncbi:epithelial cell-transforming sequence 2 oncogene-like isoform X1 [Nematostella vectensis]|uniref:epithelial cell-transforming sequence 2 oncogene-like isoform X1 n=1 Tax=Nematostella vectensis TaxID=45351 RepID=UPI0020775B34|nr:epithelial cell-transforming sequence 2 oncogene-like isoform X1 [Nematostella vectensis]